MRATARAESATMGRCDSNGLSFVNLLSATAGTFERTGGDIAAGASAYVEDLSMVLEGQNNAGEVYAHAAALAQSGSSWAHNEVTVEALAPVGASIVLPIVSYAWVGKLGVGETGIWVADGNEGTNAEAEGVFTVHLAPGVESGVLHANLWLIAYGGGVTSGNAELNVDELTVRASLTSHGFGVGSIYTGVNGNGDWMIYGASENGINSGSGVNFHFTFSVPVSDGQQFEFRVYNDGRAWARSYELGAEAGGIWDTGASVWGYITAENEDLTPGDFNADGTVNGDDYELWREGSPLADANCDGVVDGDDFDIWSGNATNVQIVTSESDGGTGSLRDAINNADPGSAIVFDPTVDYITLSYDGNSDGIADPLTIDSDISIIGPGADLLTIDGGEVWGSTSSSGFVINDATVAITDLTLLDCYSDFFSAGIVATDSDVTLERAVVSGAYAPGGTGGVDVMGGSMTIVDSTIENNSSTVVAGVNVYSGDLTVQNSTVSGNAGPYGWSGIVFNGDDLLLENTTVSGNWGYSAGVLVFGADASAIVNCTIYDNNGQVDYAGLYGTNTLVYNSIVAGNHFPWLEDADSDVSGTFDTNSSHNLIGYDPNEIFVSSYWNIIGISSAIDPHLAALDYYGGRTKTHALLSDSLAIDAGDNTFASDHEAAFDQRGKGYSRIVDWNDDMDALVDIGAFELAVDELYT